MPFTPKVSVCIPVFNGQETIRETIQSVLNQHFIDFEIVIVDNASTDETVKIVENFRDERIRLIRNPVTVPAGENWTKCVQMARGEWTKLLCADDLLTRNALLDSLYALETCPKAIGVVGSRNVINKIGREVLTTRNLHQYPRLLDHAQLIKMSLSTGTNPIAETLCVMWKSQLTDRVGGFSSKWNFYLDLDYWLRLTLLGSLVVIPQQVGSFRVTSSSWTSQLGLSALFEAKKFYLAHQCFARALSRSRYRAFVMAICKILLRKIFTVVAGRRTVQKAV